MAFLSVEHDGVRYTTEIGQKLRIGRFVGFKHLNLDDEGASRKHATIYFVDGHYILVDKKSFNGTFVNGKKIEGPHKLKDNDRIRIGRTRLYFHAGDDKTENLVCGICHSPIVSGEQTSTCDECDVIYHADCWHENLGCASYGCPKVNSVKPGDAPVEAEAKEEIPVFEEEPESAPPDYLLLAGSVLAALVGSLAFGALSLIVGYIALRRLKNAGEHQAITRGALIVSILGLLGGAVASYYWWK